MRVLILKIYYIWKPIHYYNKRNRTNYSIEVNFLVPKPKLCWSEIRVRRGVSVNVKLLKLTFVFIRPTSRNVPKSFYNISQKYVGNSFKNVSWLQKPKIDLSFGFEKKCRTSILSSWNENLCSVIQQLCILYQRLQISYEMYVGLNILVARTTSRR